MDSSPGQARVVDLTFRVFGRGLHPDWFSVRAHRRVAVDGWQADLRIIDGGHAVTFEILIFPWYHIGSLDTMLATPINNERN